MDPETNLREFYAGATVLLFGCPIGMKVGFDLKSWNTGEKFKGIKMISEGIHYLYWRFVRTIRVK